MRGCCVGSRLGMPEIMPSVFIAAASRYMGFLELNKCFFKWGCFECGGISRFFNVREARSWVRVCSCRKWFQFDENIYFLTRGWPTKREQQRGYHTIIGTSVCVDLIFERAGRTSDPGPPLAARNSSSVHGTTPDEGSLL